MLIYYSCKSEDPKVKRIKYIDNITSPSSRVVNKVFTDTLITKDDTIYTHYHYDNSDLLTLIYIEETATENKYLSYIKNDSLLKIAIENRNPNYSSDAAARYYLIGDSVFYAIETRGKFRNLSKFILDQKRNIRYFKDSLIKDVR